jgi:Flp pilus assembly protein TadG
MTTARMSSASARRQRGVYAVEFGIVFLISFALLYTIICYGIIFTLRFGLQNAAEDGARAALRYQTNWSDRKGQAEQVALLQTQGWLPVTPVIVATRCQDQPSGTTTCETGGASTLTCDGSFIARCQVVVTVTANSMRQVLPPLIGFILPDSLVGQASMLLDGRPI